MSPSAADRIREKTKAIKKHQADTGTAGSTEPKPPAPRVQKPRTKAVRRTVDLPASHHDQLSMWCTEAAREQGRARVTGQDVLRALVARLLTDETLARKIRADIAADQ